VEQPKYFVVVFGDPEPGLDHVESGRYAAKENAPRVGVEPGDLLLLYCTEKYRKYPMRVPGMGIAVHSSNTHLDYRWLGFTAPILRAELLNKLDEDDRVKMGQLGMNTRRVFEISQSSFGKVIAGRVLSGR
jgi:hypothetical protein